MEPEFGWGAGGRALRTPRDRAAEEIREVLRGAGCLPWREERDAAGGFVVAAARAGTLFFVDCEDEPPRLAGELTRYAGILRAAGYRVDPHPGDDATLLVHLPSDR